MALPDHLDEPSPPALSLQFHLEDVEHGVREAFGSNNRKSAWHTPWRESLDYRSKMYSDRRHRITIGPHFELKELPKDENILLGLPDTPARQAGRPTYRIPEFIGFLRVDDDYHPLFVAKIIAVPTNSVAPAEHNGGPRNRQEAYKAISKAEEQVTKQAIHAFSEFKTVDKFQFLHAFIIQGVFFRLYVFHRKERLAGEPLQVTKVPFSNEAQCLFEYNEADRHRLELAKSEDDEETVRLMCSYGPGVFAVSEFFEEDTVKLPTELAKVDEEENVQLMR
ncbi:hypothetical protein DFH11DRAFT_1542011 [Phellopilus nigrolimitatus]|nr:hypothetical protein DFH11DRAFT_1542011 [Phellopilus nigrolimitatus]